MPDQKPEEKSLDGKRNDDMISPIPHTLSSHLTLFLTTHGNNRALTPFQQITVTDSHSPLQQHPKDSITVNNCGKQKKPFTM